ncbi:HAMP domain-containing protein [Rhodococcus sp. 27YEA15]|uniref:hypothetical protein n=1 Tax=Rhodococcus sp. 27YEA15 TaxID=3156259 RepID=UPI003C7C67CD
MTDPDDSPVRPTRPAPPRPDVFIRPLRASIDDKIPTAVQVAISTWIGSTVVLAGIFAVTVTRLTDVRTTLETATAVDNPGYSATDISEAVTVVLVGSGGGALVMTLLVFLSVQLLRARKQVGRTLSAIVGVLAVAGGLGFRSLTTAATEIGAGALSWGPILYCVLAAVAAATAFVPGVGTWLDSPHRPR